MARGRFGFGGEGLESVGVSQNDGEDIVEIVRDPACQSPQAFHFLRLDELLLESLSLGVVKQIDLQLRQSRLR